MGSATTVKIYGNGDCAYCAAARMLLSRRGVEFEDVSVSAEPKRLAEMQQLSGRRSIPPIFIGAWHVGGFDELCELDKNGELDRMLTEN